MLYKGAEPGKWCRWTGPSPQGNKLAAKLQQQLLHLEISHIGSYVGIGISKRRGNSGVKLTRKPMVNSWDSAYHNQVVSRGENSLNSSGITAQDLCLEEMSLVLWLEPFPSCLPSNDYLTLHESVPKEAPPHRVGIRTILN